MLKKSKALWGYLVANVFAKELVPHQVRKTPLEVVALAILPTLREDAMTLHIAESHPQGSDGGRAYGF
jgi:hypothetical protein